MDHLDPVYKHTFLRPSKNRTKFNEFKFDLNFSFTITDFKLMFFVIVVKVLRFKSQIDSSRIKPIVDEPRENKRSPHRGSLFVFVNKRFEIKI